MKRFLLFSGDIYYPGKAWEDFRGDFDTKEDAEDFLFDTPNIAREWYQIVDITTRIVVKGAGISSNKDS